MKKCVIITSYIEGCLNEIIGSFEPDFILCADGGYDYAASCGIKPDMLIGDLDSITVPNDPAIQTVIYPSEKDDTDTCLCLQKALDLGYQDILIAGGLGGRLDHTVSNIHLICGKSSPDTIITIKDENNSCTVLNNCKRVFPKKEGSYISLFSMTEETNGVTASGVKYPLKNATMKMGSTLGTSNEFTDDNAYISVDKGILLVVLSKE